MTEVLATATAWTRSQGVALATVVSTTGSAPRPTGTLMAVAADGSVAGSLSGGCVEGAVHAIALEVIESGVPELHTFGYADADAFATGLTCGGRIEVFIERMQAADDLVEAIADHRPVASAVVIDHPDAALRGTRWTIPGPAATSSLEQAVRADARALIEAGATSELTYGVNGERVGDDVRVLITTWAAPPRLIVFGAVDFAAALARIAPMMGYRVTVCDARPTFATAERFPGVEVVVDWPHRYLAREAEAGGLDRRTAVCVLTHDPKFDAPALETALALDLAYVGAMGSRRAHDERIARLEDAGVSAAALARLHSPIGLDLGAATPEETAVAILSEILLTRNHTSGQPLSRTAGHIHPSPQPGDVPSNTPILR
ncbi:MAG: XdhC family protein [Marmoricola sp.]